MNASSSELQQLQGALDVLFTLREEFAQWAEEAQDESKQEALENVLAHIEAIEQEYRRRLQDAAGRK
jgi:tRNA 2-selenouridine synthase SelU